MQDALPDIVLDWIANPRPFRTIDRVRREGNARNDDYHALGAMIEDVAPAPVQKIKDIPIAWS